MLAIAGIKTLTDPNTLPTVIADAVTLVKDPKAAVQQVPEDLLNAVKTIVSIPASAAGDIIGTLEGFLGKLGFPGKALPTPAGEGRHMMRESSW